MRTSKHALDYHGAPNCQIQNLQQITIHPYATTLVNAVEETIGREWLDLDRSLVQFRTSHSIGPKVTYEVEAGKVGFERLYIKFIARVNQEGARHRSRVPFPIGIGPWWYDGRYTRERNVYLPYSVFPSIIGKIYGLWPDLGAWSQRSRMSSRCVIPSETFKYAYRSYNGGRQEHHHGRRTVYSPTKS